MGMHAHTHGHGRHAQLILSASAVATLAYVALALIMGLRAHSLALVSEAGHNLTDFLALLLTFTGVYFQSKPPTAQKTFGFHRAGVLAALANVVSLFVITILIVVDAVHRLAAPQPVATAPMIWVAAVGLVMNTTIALLLESGRTDVNIGAAFLHMAGDALATALVLIGAVAIRRTGMNAIDPILSLVIAALIVVSGWNVLRDTLNILLEGAPRGMRPDEVRTQLIALDGVAAVHDLHIWSLGSHAHALSAHIQIADIPPSQSEQIRRRCCAMLAQRYQIRHATLQFENTACEQGDQCHIAPQHDH
jgi:cobalt-zinc-cadmium efflux system protein